ncbi:MAG: DUF4198 domain-containing protein [Proteobacteria bacterium]|nr:DUF4198 domain-containing protein [Pseudomonadota bacterium]
MPAPFRQRLIDLRRAALFAAMASLIAANSAAAHDFWVQPQAYWVKPQAETTVTLQVGHGPFRQRSPIPLHRITRFMAVAPDRGVIDLRANLHLGAKTEDGAFRFRAPGAYVIVFKTDDHAQSFLPAIRFNDYLNFEGLTLALEQRKRTHQMDADGSENYSRVAKSIVQVGPPVPASQSRITEPLGLPLEIVPEANPYSEPRPPTLPVCVIFEGRRLAGALIMLTNLEHDAAPVEMHRTDRAGRARFKMPTNGYWLLNVVWTKPQPMSRDTDFETTFSSLSFGFPSSRP